MGLAAAEPRSDLSWTVPYLRIPFVERGRSMRGVDCRGVVFLILERERGAVIPEPSALYAGTDLKDAAGQAAFVRAELGRWSPCAVQPFAALLFEAAGLPVHVGLALGDGLFIHARKGAGVTIGHLDEADPGEARWGRRLLGAYRHDG